MRILELINNGIMHIGEAIFYLKDILSLILRGRIRWNEVLSQMFEQGVRSTTIVILTSMASGVVLALQGTLSLHRFGAKELVARLVALSLVREFSPVFTALIFSGKAGAGITAELGTMTTQEQIEATRVLGIDPMEYLVVPRFLACVLVLPILVVVSEVFGLLGGYLVSVYQAHLPGSFFIREVVQNVGYVDLFSGYIKIFVFSIIIGWICCYQGFYTKGGALGVGRFTTQAVAYSYITIILSDAFLTKIILTMWG